MNAKGLGVIAVHFCFQLNEDMIMRLNACLIFLLLYFVVLGTPFENPKGRV